MNTDFALMEMNSSPANNARFSWLGWDRSGNTPTTGTGIHHPAGDVMKISFDYHSLVPNNSTIDWGNSIISPVSTHWTVGYDHGTTEGGSSGSPLFDQNKRVIGQLHGGDSGCAPITKYYGRFNLSWTGGGTNDTRLSNWLDPTGSGVITVNTSRSVNVPSIYGPNEICTTGTYGISNPPLGAYTVTWSSSGFTPATGTGNTFSVTASGLGNDWVSATITQVGLPNISLPRYSVYTKGYNPIVGPDELYYGIKEVYSIEPSGVGGVVYSYLWEGTNLAITPGIGGMANTCKAIANINLPGKVMLTCTVVTSCGTFKAIKDIDVIFDSPAPAWKVYPNPASSVLHLTSEHLSNTTESSNTQKQAALSVQLASVSSGQVLRNQTVTIQDGNFDLDLSNIPNGHYTITLMQGNQTVFSQVIVVQH